MIQIMDNIFFQLVKIIFINYLFSFISVLTGIIIGYFIIKKLKFNTIKNNSEVIMQK